MVLFTIHSLFLTAPEHWLSCWRRMDGWWISKSGNQESRTNYTNWLWLQCSLVNFKLAGWSFYIFCDWFHTLTLLDVCVRCCLQKQSRWASSWVQIYTESQSFRSAKLISLKPGYSFGCRAPFISIKAAQSFMKPKELVFPAIRWPGSSVLWGPWSVRTRYFRQPNQGLALLVFDIQP